ncbi:MAG: hypothetical protein JW762_01845 [Dehalococcoidales bacterium]|nr:hypothetical protein [Dehalococcoidales bacterium]
MKLLKYLLVIVIVFFVPLPGCTNDDSKSSLLTRDFTFTGTWEEVLEITGAKEDPIYIQSFSYSFRGTRLKGMSGMFLSEYNEGSGTGFFNFYMDLEGELQWSGNENDGEWPDQLYYDPSEIFREMDKIGLDKIVEGAESTSIRIDPFIGEMNYRYRNMFYLKDGELLPLRTISFNSTERSASIHLDSFYSHDPEAPFLLDSIRDDNMQVWFVTGDLEKASEVEYLENQQGPEFKEFVAGIHEILPLGWEMMLTTQESMQPPHGLGEPLFRLDFTDTINKFNVEHGIESIDISPGLRLVFYDIDDKQLIMDIIETEKIYSWDIPQYYDESLLYIAVTSPVYINSGFHDDEVMKYYEPLEKALKSYFAEERNSS